MPVENEEDLQEDTYLDGDDSDSNEELDTQHEEGEAPEEVEEDNGDAEDTDAGDSQDDTADGDDDSDEAPDDSLTSQEQASKPQVDYESRFKGAQRSWQKERDQRTQAEQRLRELEERLRAQEQTATQQSLDPWNPKSPRHQEFSQTLQKYDMFRQALDKAQGEDAQRAVADAFAPMFTEDEKAALQRHQQHLAHVQRQLATPEGQAEYMGQLVEQKLAAVLSQREEIEQTKAYYRDLYNQPQYKAILSDPTARESFRSQLLSMGDNPPPNAVELVLENMRLSSTMKKVPKTLAKAKAEELSAREQRRLSKGHAKAERDQGVTRRRVDPVTEAKRICAERGIEWGSPKSFLVLDEVE